MDDKLMYITNDDTQNYSLTSLDTQLNKPTNQNPIKVPKDAKPTYKKTLL